jgi:DNA-binding SARP family transcriptional activator
VQLCGRLAVERDGQRTESRLPGRQGALLLAYLAANADRWVTRNELIDAVWAAQAPADAPDALASLLSKVRRVVGSDQIPGRSLLRFALNDETFVDVHYAQDALHRAETRLAAGDAGHAWQPAHTAYAIARRTFLAGCEADWINVWRNRLVEVSAAGLECLTESLMQFEGGNLLDAEKSARILIELAPFRESGYRLLMQALERAGNNAEALRVFDDLRCLLAAELGVAPGPEVAAVHARLIRGEASRA